MPAATIAPGWSNTYAFSRDYLGFLAGKK